MSQLTVASYLMGIPPGNSNQEKPKIIHNFINEANGTGTAYIYSYFPFTSGLAYDTYARSSSYRVACYEY